MNKKRKTELAVFLIRWWSVGAVYFFIAWGTRLGQYTSLFDLVFFLGLTIGIFHTLIVNPALKMLFNVGWHKPYAESTFKERFLCRIKDLSLALATVLLVAGVYELINLAAHRVLPLEEGAVFLPGEPILFGLFYALLLHLFLRLFSLFKRRSRS